MCVYVCMQVCMYAGMYVYTTLLLFHCRKINTKIAALKGLV